MYHAFGERLSRGGYHKEKKMKLISKRPNLGSGLIWLR